MRTWKILLHLLLTLLLSIGASGVVSAKIASGDQNLTWTGHQAENVFNWLTCQGKSDRSTTGPPECSVVTKRGVPRNPDGTFAKVDGPTAGKPVDSATRQRILERDRNPDGSWTCATCGQTTRNPANIHTGHIKARSRGGDLSDGNLRCEGAACNLSQGAGSAPKPGRTCAARGSCGAPYGRTD